MQTGVRNETHCQSQTPQHLCFAKRCLQTARHQESGGGGMGGANLGSCCFFSGKLVPENFEGMLSNASHYPMLHLRLLSTPQTPLGCVPGIPRVRSAALKSGTPTPPSLSATPRPMDDFWFRCADTNAPKPSNAKVAGISQTTCDVDVLPKALIQQSVPRFPYFVLQVLTHTA